jgi:hypothetical protein
MRCWCWFLAACCLATVHCGCDSSKSTPQPAAQPVTAQEFVGKWRLIKAGGQPPAALNIKSLRIDIAADGSWVSEIEMQGQFAGISMKGGGKWSLADSVVSYTSGDNAGKSRARLVSGRLVLEPDFSVRRDGTEEVAGEYER